MKHLLFSSPQERFRMWVILVLMTLIMTTEVLAQITSYTRSTFTGSYSAITGSSGPSGDDNALNISLPFSFTFDGHNYTQARICTNGWVELGSSTRPLSTSTSTTNSNLFTTAIPNKTLAPWWDDLDTGSGSIVYTTLGSSPSRVFVIEWKSVLSYFTGGKTINFQLRLYEGSNVIEFWYGSSTGTASASESASFGIEDHIGGSGHFIDGPTGSTTAGTTNLTTANWPTVFYRFTPPATPALSITSFTPGRNALNIPKNTNLTLTFNTDINTATLTNSTIKVNGSLSGRHTSNSIAYNASTRTVTFDPTFDFYSGETVTVTVTRGIRSTSGDTLSTPHVWNFRVASSAANAVFTQTDSAIASASGFYPMAASDFDGDGDIDFAVIRTNRSDISILRNNGTGTFSIGSTLANVGTNLNAIAAADIDSDGHVDLVVVVGSSGTNRLAILTNNGSGSFSITANIGLQGYPTAVAIGDFDGNGFLDMATTNHDGQTVSIIRNLGALGFSVSSIPSIAWPNSIATGDVDNDGDLDLVIVGGGATQGTFSVMKNDGTGSFAQTSTVNLGSISSTSPALGDFDGDGDLDAAVAITGNLFGLGTAVAILRNNGSGTFTQSSSVTVGTLPYGTIVGDFDGDSDLDVVVGNERSQTFSLLRNNGSGSFTSTSFSTTSRYPNHLVAGDLDGDGDLDLAVSDSSKIGIFRNSPAGVNLTYNQIDAAAFPTITSYVTVNDAAGAPIAGLTSSNFTVQENGVNQSPIYVSPVGGTGTSISVALVIDRSGSMSGSPLRDAITAAITFVRQMRPGDRAAVYSFDENVYLNQDFTSDTSRLISAINAITEGGYTAIYDAMLQSVTRTSQQVGRKAVILLTDGADNSSHVSVDSAINYAQRQSIPVYTIGLGLSPGSAEESVLQRIAQETGGAFYSAPASSDLVQIYQRISQQLQNQYSITYSTSNPARDGSVRTVTVRVSYNNQTDSKQRQYTAPSGLSLAPRIIFVRDVPNDQGGKVIVKWQSSALDTNVTTLSSYSVWRAVPEGMRSSTSSMSQEQAPGGIIFRQTMVNGALMGWEFLTNLPAHRFTSYTYTASTLYDSMSTTKGWHYFLVSAHTNNANVFYDSNVDSGYSVDNIPPLGVRNLAGNSSGGRITLWWSMNTDDDLRHYVIYRTQSANFNADTVRSLATVRDTVFIDQNPIVGTSYYFVRAQDIHDNLSPFSAVLSFTVTNVLHDPMEIPHQFSISQNYPNPFNPSTTIRYALPSRSYVKLEILNLLGQRVVELVNSEQDAGYYNVQWTPNAPSGIYFYRIEAVEVSNPSKLFVDVKKMVLLR